MAKMNGVNDHFERMKKAQGVMRVAPGTHARNSLSMGGVNQDLGGGATDDVSEDLAAGKASSSPTSLYKG